jgi:hypothetical protein
MNNYNDIEKLAVQIRLYKKIWMIMWVYLCDEILEIDNMIEIDNKECNNILFEYRLWCRLKIYEEWYI